MNGTYWPHDTPRTAPRVLRPSGPSVHAAVVRVHLTGAAVAGVIGRAVVVTVVVRSRICSASAPPRMTGKATTRSTARRPADELCLGSRPSWRPATPATTPRWKPAHRRRRLRDTLRLLLVFAHDQVFAHNRNGTVTYVCNCYGLTEDQVFVAYDTANDIEMLRTHPRAILVRNFDDELDGLPEIVQAYSVSPEYARGVIEVIDNLCRRTAVPE